MSISIQAFDEAVEAETKRERDFNLQLQDRFTDLAREHRELKAMVSHFCGSVGICGSAEETQDVVFAHLNALTRASEPRP